jgi:hypothetical protein
MNNFDNYIYHKIALVTYNMYEDNVISLKSKGLPVKYYSHYDFVKTLSVHFLNVQKAVVNDTVSEKIVKNTIARIMGDVEDIYGIKNVSVGVMIYDFFSTSIWYEWIKIVSDTKKYFGV